MSKYPPTANGHSPFLIEDGMAWFSIKCDNGYKKIITTEYDYTHNNGEHADMMIRCGYSLREPRRKKK